MKKLLLTFFALLSFSLAYALQDTTTVTSGTDSYLWLYDSPINPTQDVVINFDGSNSNFGNWTPAVHIHAWLVAKDGMTLSQTYGTTWASCNSDADYTALPDSLKMTHTGGENSGTYTITLNLQNFFNIADEDLIKIGSLGLIARTQYSGDGNQSPDALLSVDRPVVEPTLIVSAEPTVYIDQTINFTVNALNFTTPTLTYYVKTPSATDFVTIPTTTYTPLEEGLHEIMVTASQDINGTITSLSDTVEVNVLALHPMVIKVMVPASWTDTITFFTWDDNSYATSNIATLDSNGWYSYTYTHYQTLNLIARNGMDWSTMDNQTVDIVGLSDSTCIQIDTTLDADGKHNYILVDCATITPSTEPTLTITTNSIVYIDQTIHFTVSALNLINPTLTYYIKTPSATDYVMIPTTTYAPLEEGRHNIMVTASQDVNGTITSLSDTVEVNVLPLHPIVIKVRIPSTWNDTITFYTWDDHGYAASNEATLVSNGWYSYTYTHFQTLNLIVRNGMDWSTVDNQTSDILGLTDTTCIQIDSTTNGDGKYDYVLVDCSSILTSIEPNLAHTATVSAFNHTISIKLIGQNDYKVYNMFGQIVSNGRFENQTQLEVNAGIYILVVNNQTIKILVP